MITNLLNMTLEISAWDHKPSSDRGLWVGLDSYAEDSRVVFISNTAAADAEERVELPLELVETLIAALRMIVAHNKDFPGECHKFTFSEGGPT